MYKIVISSEPIREALLETTLGDRIVAITPKPSDDVVYVLSIQDHACTEISPQELADVLEAAIAQGFDVLYLDDLSTLARMYKMHTDHTETGSVCCVVRPPMFFQKPADDSVEIAQQRSRNADDLDTGSRGAITVGVLGFAVALGIIGLAASRSRNTRNT